MRYYAELSFKQSCVLLNHSRRRIWCVITPTEASNMPSQDDLHCTNLDASLLGPVPQDQFIFMGLIFFSSILYCLIRLSLCKTNCLCIRRIFGMTHAILKKNIVSFTLLNALKLKIYVLTLMLIYIFFNLK